MLFNSISAICYLTVFQLYCGMVMLFDVLGILKKWRERALKKSSCFISMTFITLIFFLLSEINFVLLEYLAKVWTEWRHTKALIISSLSG